MQEAARGAQRAQTLGAYGWLKPQKTNKTFLNNTLKSVLLANSIADRKAEKVVPMSSSRKCSQSSCRDPISNTIIRGQSKFLNPENASHSSSNCSSQYSPMISGQSSRSNCSYRDKQYVDDTRSSSDSSDCVLVLDSRKSHAFKSSKRKRTTSPQSSSSDPSNSPKSKHLKPSKSFSYSHDSSGSELASQKPHYSIDKRKGDESQEHSSTKRSKSRHKRSNCKHKSRKQSKSKQKSKRSHSSKCKSPKRSKSSKHKSEKQTKHKSSRLK